MRAVICAQYGAPEVLAPADVAAPGPPDAGDVLIDVEYAGVSFADALKIGNRHQNRNPLPFTPGAEVAGRVVATGAGVEGLAAGKRVAALLRRGGYAERALARRAECFALPAAVATRTAAALLGSGLTAYLALAETARVQPGETVVVAGAAGGVGLLAVQVARALGAVTVAAAGSATRAAVAREHGAEQVIDYSREPFRDRVRELTGGRGADVIIDPVGTPFADNPTSFLDWGGRYVVVGFAGGRIPAFEGNRLLVKNRSALGFALGYYRRRRPELMQRAGEALLAMVADGRVRPLLGQVAPLEEAPRVLRRLLDRELVGKAVLAVHPGCRGGSG